MRTPGPRPARPGLTIVEVLVALVLVTAGLLAMSGASALAVRAAAEAARSRTAVARAEWRLASLRSAGCGAAASGVLVDAGGGVRETWTVSPAAAGFARVREEVQWTTPGPARRGVRRLVVEGVVPC